MADVSGVVQNIYQDGTINTRHDEKPLYKVVVNGQEYKHAFKKPSCESGDYVSFNVKSRYPTDIDDRSLKVGAGADRSGGTDTAPPSGGSAPAATGLKAKSQGIFPVPVDHPDRSILRQNALASARDVVLKTIEPGITTYDDEKTHDEIADEIIRLAHQFERYSAGDEIAEAIEEMGADGHE